MGAGGYTSLPDRDQEWREATRGGVASTVQDEPVMKRTTQDMTDNTRIPPASEPSTLATSDLETVCGGDSALPAPLSNCLKLAQQLPSAVPGLTTQQRESLTVEAANTCFSTYMKGYANKGPDEWRKDPDDPYDRSRR
jgi:hypothetical protein